MKDLTTVLETEIAQAINKFRNTTEEAMQTLHTNVQDAHQKFDVAAGLRVQQAHEAMAQQITTFLGKEKEPEEKYETLPKVDEAALLDFLIKEGE